MFGDEATIILKSCEWPVDRAIKGGTMCNVESSGVYTSVPGDEAMPYFVLCKLHKACMSLPCRLHYQS